MTQGEPGHVEKSPGSALAILLGLLIAGGLALYALTRKPPPPQPVQTTPAPNPQASWPQTGPPVFPTPPASPPPPPPPVAELVGEQSTDQPELVPVAPPAAKTPPALPEPPEPPGSK